MSYASLVKLALLCGADVPPKSLYRDRWPTRLERAGRVAHHAILTLGGRARRSIAVTGAKLPGCSGEVRLIPARARSIVDPHTCILPGANATSLAEALELDLSTDPIIHLADCGVLVVIGRRRGKMVVIHIVDEPERAARYVEGCERASAALRVVGLAQLAPEILCRKTHPAGEIIESSGLPGSTINPRQLTSERLISYITAALVPLKRLVRPARPSLAPDAQLLTRITRTIDGKQKLSEHASWSIPAWNEWRLRQDREATVAHGDYWLSNILFGLEPVPEVSGIVDWERSRESAVVGIDALQLISMSFAHWRNCDPLNVLCMVWSNTCEPTLENCLQLAMDHFQLSRDDLGYLAIQVWLMHLTQHASECESWPHSRWHDWVSNPCEYAQRWLQRR